MTETTGAPFSSCSVVATNLWLAPGVTRRPDRFDPFEWVTVITNLQRVGFLSPADGLGASNAFRPDAEVEVARTVILGSEALVSVPLEDRLNSSE
jgi:hypothetical protein